MLGNSDGWILKGDSTGCIKAQGTNDIKMMQKYKKNRKW
jgi:hypothetical protein